MADLAEVIIDASALIEAFAGAKPDPGLRRRVLTKRAAAPELLDVEVADVLRRMVLQHELSEEDARDTLVDIVATPIARTPHRELIGRVWELRHSIRAYDAAYVALAEKLAVPLVTCDAKLARSNAHEAKIELFPRS